MDGKKVTVDNIVQMNTVVAEQKLDANAEVQKKTFAAETPGRRPLLTGIIANKDATLQKSSEPPEGVLNYLKRRVFGR